MRILHVYKDVFPPVTGGIERHMSLMCRFQKEHADVAILACSGEARGRRREIDSVPVREVGEWGRFQQAPFAPTFPLRLRQHRADIVVIHLPNPTAAIGWLLARPRGKLVVRYQSDIVRQAGAMRYYAPVLRRFLSRADAIIASSELYRDSSPFLSPHADRCHVIPLGVLPEEFDPPAGETIEALRVKYGGPFAFFCGRHRYYKGLEYLVEASKNIRAAVVIGGEGPASEELRGYAESISAPVRFTGALSHADLVAHLHACSVFVFPSVERSEAFGMSILEAHACAKPVVATRLGTGVEYANLDGVTGINVPPRDAQSLADAANRLLLDTDLAKEMGDHARERVLREFDARGIAQRELELYESLLR